MTTESSTSTAKLRDIRDDLRDRILLAEKAMTEEQQSYEQQAKALTERYRAKFEELKIVVAGYRRMLEFEEARVRGGANGTTASFRLTEPKTPLADFLCTALAERGGKSKEELRDLAQAAGYFPAGEGGRSLHATLVNIVRSGRAVEQDGVYSVRRRV